MNLCSNIVHFFFLYFLLFVFRFNFIINKSKINLKKIDLLQQKLINIYSFRQIIDVTRYKCEAYLKLVRSIKTSLLVSPRISRKITDNLFAEEQFY